MPSQIACDLLTRSLPRLKYSKANKIHLNVCGLLTVIGYDVTADDVLPANEGSAGSVVLLPVLPELY